MLKRVWVDYNNTVMGGLCYTLLKFADDTIQEGDTVLTYDGEGMTCEGVIEKIDSGIVTIALEG